MMAAIFNIVVQENALFVSCPMYQTEDQFNSGLLSPDYMLLCPCLNLIWVKFDRHGSLSDPA